MAKTSFTERERMLVLVTKTHEDSPLTARETMHALLDEWGIDAYLKNVVKSLNSLVHKGALTRSLTVNGYVFTVTSFIGERLADDYSALLKQMDVMPR
jgi:uncharacterized membrane-anchored protein YjiN (DUF445 family)